MIEGFNQRASEITTACKVTVLSMGKLVRRQPYERWKQN